MVAAQDLRAQVGRLGLVGVGARRGAAASSWAAVWPAHSTESRVQMIRLFNCFSTAKFEPGWTVHFSGRKVDSRLAEMFAVSENVSENMTKDIRQDTVKPYSERFDNKEDARFQSGGRET